MSIKQLAQTVRNGQLVTFHVFDAEPITGYLAGIDLPPYEVAYFVLEPYGQDDEYFHKRVISRHGSPLFTLHAQSTYADATAHDEMEQIIGPFRSWVLNHLLGRSHESTFERVAS